MTKTNDNWVSDKCWEEWTSNKAVANAGVALVNVDKKILILKPKEGRYWELPGGGINRMEKPKKAAQRELKEETDIEVDIKQLKETITVTDDNIKKTDITVTFLAHLKYKPVVKLPTRKAKNTEHIDFCWITLQERITNPNCEMNSATRKQIKG